MLRLNRSGEKNPVDPWLLWIIIALTVVGFLIFLSASVGLLAREGAPFGGIMGTRVIAVLAGAFALFLASRIHWRVLRRYSLLALLLAFALTLLVFVPGLGLEHAGARRWLNVAGFSFQPSEFLKLAIVLYAAAFFSAHRERMRTFRYGLAPLIALLAAAASVLLIQPDTDTFVVLLITLFAIFLVGGGSIRHLSLAALAGALALSLLMLSRPYLAERLQTFLDPARDPQGAGYQIQQSLIAIGSGGIFGRGFGQSVQKFSYLPEPITDSIFAVAAEEFGFVGAVTLVALLLAFLLRGLRTAARAPDLFSGLTAVGIVILIGASAFMNIASMLAVIPLSGLPLSFVSHGGTALVITLFEAGILLNISRYQKS
ncbi:MAG: putative peptidoglycan glycosyltransferase FtsW [Patescibacteria group bacterium]